MTPRPLDLRLLPAALGTWATAAAAVRLSGATALRLGLVLMIGALLLGFLVLVLRRLLAEGPGRSAGTPRAEAGRAPNRSPSRSARACQAAVHLILLCSLAGAGAITAGLQSTRHDETGWTQAIDQRAPQQLTVRASSAPRPIRGTSVDGAPQVVVEVEVLARRDAAAGGRRSVDAPAVLMLEADQGAGIDHGERLRGMLRATATDPGDRATALLTVFDEVPQQLPSDGWTRLWRGVAQLREATSAAAQSAPGEAPQLLPGMILGDRSWQSEELTTAMREAGLSHLTAVSGANCALVLGAVLAGLRLLRLPRWCAPPAAVLSLGLFVLLVHPEPSVVRAALMGGIGALALFAGRGRAAFSLLCVCVIVLLVGDPWYSREPAFALSAAATAGIVLIGTPLQRHLARVMPGWAASVLALACAAQLFVTPLLVPLAEGMSLYAIPANVLAAPLVPLVTVPGTAAAVLAAWMPGLAEVVLWCCGVPAALIAVLGRAVAELPQAMVAWPDDGAGLLVGGLYVLAALALVRALVLGRWSRRAVSMAVAGGAGLTALVLPVQAMPGVSGLPAPTPLGGGPGEAWRIAQCDVGQGDMLVVRTGEQEAIVVDAGPEPQRADACLDALGIGVVRSLMLSHEHQDHVGGVEGVVEGRTVQQVVHGGSRGWDAVAELDLSGVPVRRAEPGLGGRVEGPHAVVWRVLHADADAPEPNDASLVVHISLPRAGTGSGGGEASSTAADRTVDVLALGDLETEATDQILRAGMLPDDVDLLKVSHHGARNGGTALIEQRRPEAAVISVGAENDYGHPSVKTLRALQAAGTTTYRTDEHGTVVFSLDGGKLRARSLG